MVYWLSDAELEIMKIVRRNLDEVTLFPYILDGLAARGKSKNCCVMNGSVV